MATTQGLVWRVRGREWRITERPLLMGVVNVTPDSFSDGGQFLEADKAVAHALRLVEQGADILDIGGESTRPGAAPVALDDERRRVLPVLERLCGQVPIPISIDTYKAALAREALQMGVAIVNDVMGLRDPEMVEVVRQYQAGAIVMHMQGTPLTMQENPQYQDVVAEVKTFLQERLSSLQAAGIGREQLAIDPGIGFGKRLEHNLRLLAEGRELVALGRPICLGVSRKGFINRVAGEPGWSERGVGGTIGTLLFAWTQRACHIARVHDVGEVRRAFALFTRLEQLHAASHAC
ncbi:Dihydropteroate synthase [bacterium HR36]|uniref:Dihydropteroate synthase n=1 Tax=uncultured Planctomycetota bacterium TaxID=120965 RepID=H5SCR5_9BACT|nr:dihydropteroate synthase [uncultured Planctomycetota bacterium]GBD35331.1 Dihydropteroate synthase [bacterium HR36]